MKPPYERVADPEPGTSIDVSHAYSYKDPGSKYLSEYFVTYVPTHWLTYNGVKGIIGGEPWRVQVMIIATNDCIEYHTSKSINPNGPQPVVRQYRENGGFGPISDRWATEETIKAYKNRYQVMPIVENDSTTELLPVRQHMYDHVFGIE